MPRGYGPRKFYKSFHGRGPRHHGAHRIQRAWRNRKRKRLSLVSRTALSNRRAIKKVNRNIETQVQELRGAVSTSTVPYIGNWLINMKVDSRGGDTTGNIPFYAHLVAGTPLQVAATAAGGGNSIYSYKGRWVQMKSLTIKGCVEANSDSGASAFQRVTFIMCLDRCPAEGQSSLLSTTATANKGLLTTYLPAISDNSTDLAFYNLNTTGKAGRFKVLKRWHVTVSPSNDLTANTVPAIAPAAPPATYGSARAAYTSAAHGLSKHYPPLVYFSHTIKGNYKFNYGDTTNVGASGPTKPTNQDIVLFAFSSTYEGGTPVASLPRFSYASRFRFKDP